MRFVKAVFAAPIIKRLLSIALMLFLILGVILVRSPRTSLHAQSGHSITLSWTFPLTGTQPTGFNIKRGLTSGSEVTVTTIPAGVSPYTWADTGIAGGGVGGTTYFYKISGTNPNANPTESPDSNEVSATFLPLGSMAAPTASGAASK